MLRYPSTRNALPKCIRRSATFATCWCLLGRLVAFALRWAALTMISRRWRREQKRYGGRCIERHPALSPWRETCAHDYRRRYGHTRAAPRGRSTVRYYAARSGRSRHDGDGLILMVGTRHVNVQLAGSTRPSDLSLSGNRLANRSGLPPVSWTPARLTMRPAQRPRD